MYPQNLMQHFFGRPVVDYVPKKTTDLPQDVAYRLSHARVPISRRLEQLCTEMPANQIEALVIGKWKDARDYGSPEYVLDALVAHATELTRLRALFVGDMVFEIGTLSSITQCGYKRLLDAFPSLEYLGIRGSHELRIDTFRHDRLRELVIEAASLPDRIVRRIAESDLPALECLELWGGGSGSGVCGYASPYIESLAILMDKSPLRHVRLCHSVIGDGLAQALAKQS